ncbi:endospore germination permease [Paenibacillus roseipurpureus]|uniref:Endospore germination permease n=1 Tax=Paenibacillus roseopurpureus TaxID=2918901 RepID=A0AA96LSK7_9BACL|nr:endospore germination permease [Paenibacillus sp. MBLB1832]WNR46486.1 endospore germination permease [Paenibacillus sp. MBLB1832]
MSSFSNPKINPIQGLILCMSASTALAQISGAIISIEQAKRDTFVSSLIGCIAYLLYAFWIYRIVNNQAPNQSFLDVLELKMGSLFAWSVRYWIALYLMCELFVIDKNIVTWVKSLILPYTPIWAISLPFLIVCAYLAVKGIKPIAISISVLMPAFLFLTVFMAVFTYKYRHFDLLLPLFSEGARPILEGVTTTVRAGMELFLLLLLKPYTEGTFKWKHFVAEVSVFSFFIINGAVSMLTIFGPYEASLQRFPLFTQWRLVRISSFLEHLDFLSMYQWLSSTTIQISLGLFLIGDLLTSRQRPHKIAIMTCATALFISVELRLNDSDFLAFTKYYFYPISTLSILCWTTLAYFTTRKRGLS